MLIGIAKACLTLPHVYPAALSRMLLPLAAESPFKLMAIKDEYGVARLYSQMGFINQLKDAFGGSVKIKYHFAPPILTLGRGPRGRPTKYKFGSCKRGRLG